MMHHGPRFSTPVTMTVLLCSVMLLLSCARFPVDLSGLLPEKKSDLCAIQHAPFYDFQAPTLNGASPDQQAVLSVDGAPQAFTMYIEPTTGAVIEEWDYFTLAKQVLFTDGVYQGGLEVPLPEIIPYAGTPEPAVFPWEIGREFTADCVVALAGPAFFDTSAMVLSGWNDGNEIARLWTLAGGGSMITVDGHLALLSIDPGEAVDLEQFKIRDFYIGTLGEGDSRLGAILSPGSEKRTWRLSLSPRGQGSTKDGTEYIIDLQGSNLRGEFAFGENASAGIVSLDGVEQPVAASGTLTLKREAKLFSIEISAIVDGHDLQLTGLLGNGFWEDTDGQTAQALGDRSPRVVVQAAASTPVAISPTQTTIAPAPSAVNPAAPDATQTEAKSSWRLVLEDTFENNANGWPITYGTEGDLVYFQSDLFEEQYLVHVEYRAGVQPMIRRTIDFDLGEAFLIEADVMQEGPPQTDCGLVISSADEAVSVRFNIDSNEGVFSLAKKTGSAGWEELLAWTTSPQINNGKLNKLSIVGYSEGIMVFINSKLAAFSEISAIDVQRLGFTASVTPENSVTCTFDNLRVSID
ncbi:MAG TPA: hypothetical protein PKK59_08885 [Anaerolineaceae bacterium]|nr:hypothetical protein [Anaerolineaceae bacterium]